MTNISLALINHPVSLAAHPMEDNGGDGAGTLMRENEIGYKWGLYFRIENGKTFTTSTISYFYLWDF